MSMGDQDELAEQLSLHIKELALFKYESEIRREDSLIAQAGNMQTAFSFTSAALFMVASIAVEYKEPWSYEFLLLVFSSITMVLVISLVLSTIAQKRVVREDFAHIAELKKFVSENYDESDTAAKRNIQWVDMLSKVEIELSESNDHKVVLIEWSMFFFYVAIGISLLWFVIALWLMCKG